jgi:hypothetical protein
MPENSVRRSRKQLLVLFAIAGASMLGAFALYFGAASGGVWNTTNRGTFVDPPVNLETLGYTDESGAAATTGGNWWLWVVQDRVCDAACFEALHQLEALQILLNKDASRVRRALVTSIPVDAVALRESQHDLKFRLIANGQLTPAIYIVDPLGNLVLRYPLESAGKPVLDDLKRLLKVSQIG